MDSVYDIIPEDEVQKINSALQDGDLNTAAEKLQKSLNGIEDAPLNIAITGETGVGKSTFVNAIRGMGDEEEGSAKTDVVETTMIATPYTHPQHRNVKVWDLPGIGSPNFVAEEYLELVQFSRYDFFIIMSSERFKQNDIKLAKAIQAMGKKFYFVRTKVDNDLYASKIRRHRMYNEESVLNEIRENCIKNLEDGGITEPHMFLISCLELHKYDFQEMLDILETELPEIKRHIFLISLPNISLPILEKKRQALMKKICMWAALSCAVASIPIPGLSVACDLGILVTTMIMYQKAFGLDQKSLKNLSTKAGIDIRELRSVVKSPLLLQEINKDLVVQLLTKGAMGALTLVEFAVSNIPVFGSIATAAISFGTTCWTRYNILKEMAEDASRVLSRALESSV